MFSPALSERAAHTALLDVCRKYQGDIAEGRYYDEFNDT
jgi:hypothetical protein